MNDLVPVARPRQRRLAKLFLKGERGMTTAEYAVGTVAVVSLGGILIKLFTDPEFIRMIWDLIKKILEMIQGLTA